MKHYGTAANYLINSIVEGAVRLGADRRVLIVSAGIEEASLSHDGGRQSGLATLNLWRVAEDLLNCPLVPIKIGIQSTRLHRSALTSLVEACNTLGDAIELGMRYQHVTQDIVHAQLNFSGQTGNMLIDCNEDEAFTLRPQIERQIAFIVGIASNLSPEGVDYVSGAKAEFSFAPKAPIYEYEKILGIPVQFHCKQNRLCFPRSMMTCRNFSASQEVRSCLLPLVKQQEREMVNGNTITSHVKHAIVELMAENKHNKPADIEKVAEKLNISVRTLQRRLKAQNTSFSELLDDERRKQALQWMQRIDLTMDEISYNLGFNHVTGFYNAFHRWTGQAPKRYRKLHCASKTH